MEAFTNALLRAIQIAQDECGIRQPRLRQAGQEYGGVPTAKRYFGRNCASDGFDALARAGRLELSLEALAVSAKFNALFTDEEVNVCFELLCGAGYYERKK
jgi:hypothetical protein